MKRMWIVGGGGIGQSLLERARIESYYVEMTGSSVDVRNITEVQDFVYDHFRKNKVDAVVFTAGINTLCWSKDLREGWDIEAGVMADTFMTNVVGFTNVLAALQAHNGPCRVVAVSSDAARRPMRGSLAYCASKAALNMAVQVAARELGPDGWRINAVAPGMTAPTGMSKSIDEQVPAFRNWTAKEAREYEMAQAVIKRRAKPEEVAQVIMSVVDGPDYMNGSIIEVNGGR